MAFMDTTSTSYRWPAEWEEHASTWITWPHNPDDWPGKFEPIPWIYVEIVRWLQYSEPVHILVQNEHEREQIKHLLAQSNVPAWRIALYIVPTNRSWTRDYAPIFVKDVTGRKYALKWFFNGWAKYPDWQADNQAGLTMAQLSRTPVIEMTEQGRPLVLEGGALDNNGSGMILTTEQCLLSQEQERNPGYKREDYERLFSRWLGARKVIWLAGGITGDDTHGHVDDVARFVRKDTIVLARPADRGEPDYDIYEENLRRLKVIAADGSPLGIIELPMPEPRVFNGQRLPASYVNFYVANRVVLVPIFHDPADRVALNTLAELFPGRQVVGIYCGDLILGLGALHCLTMQEPA